MSHEAPAGYTFVLSIAQKSARLPARALELVSDEDNELVFSVASIWEFGVKYAKAPDQFDVSPHDCAMHCFKMGTRSWIFQGSTFSQFRICRLCMVTPSTAS